MNDTVHRFEAALNAFDASMHGLTADQLTLPTPCADWDVTALVNHVIAELAWAPPLLAGRTVSEVGDEFAGDLLGADPCAAWHHWSGLAHTHFAAAGATDRTVHLARGEEQASRYCDELSFDLLVHSWDLARATGQDDVLPGDLVAWASRWFSNVGAGYREYGVVAPTVAVPQDAGPQTRLLAQTGRRSDWAAPQRVRASPRTS